MRVDEKYVHEKIQQAGGLKQINKSIELIQEHLTKEHLTAKGEPFVAKNYRLSLWRPDHDELYNLVVSMFTTALTTDYLTYQEMVGIHKDKLPMSKTIDRAKTIAEVTAMLCLADLINIDSKQGEYHLITPCLVLKDIPVTDKHGTVHDRPQPVESNYDPEQGNMILGGKLNHHYGKICLDHINRMNRIPLVLNKEFLIKYPEEPKDESIVDTAEKQERWGIYTTQAKRKYAMALVKAEKLYINHKPDTRGRIYAVGYYINPQGNGYKKAMLQLANKEHLDNSIAFPKDTDQVS